MNGVIHAKEGVNYYATATHELSGSIFESDNIIGIFCKKIPNTKTSLKNCLVGLKFASAIDSLGWNGA